MKNINMKNDQPEPCICGRQPNLEKYAANERQDLIIETGMMYACDKRKLHFGEMEYDYYDHKSNSYKLTEESEQNLLTNWNKGIRNIKKITGHEK